MPKSQDELMQTGDKLVPLEAHIMSKCPDARVCFLLLQVSRQRRGLTKISAQDCLRDLVLPAMQRVHDKVDFTLSFIGK